MPRLFTPIRVFIGSSAEGREVARNLQEELGAACEVTRWDQGVFSPSGYTLDTLLSVAEGVDFAVLVATPDDTTVSRGEENKSARDNIVLEFGLFAGALGRTRTFLMATGELKLPTDLLGLTRLSYRPQTNGNERAAVAGAALQIEDAIRKLGPYEKRSPGVTALPAHTMLERELDLLCSNAVAQGWTVKTNSATTLRLQPPAGKAFTLTKRRPDQTREDLRLFVSELRAAGLRVNSGIRHPVAESPL